MAVDGPRRSRPWPNDWWRGSAACRTQDRDLFFPVGVTGNAARQIEVAKAVCAACQTRSACLVFAVESNQEYGVWGGTTEEERRLLRRAFRLKGESWRDEASVPPNSS